MWKIEPTIFSTFDGAGNSIATYRPVKTPEDDGTGNGWAVLVRADKLDVAKRIVRAVDALDAVEGLREAARGLRIMVENVLTDSQLDHPHCGATIRNALTPFDTTLAALDAALGKKKELIMHKRHRTKKTWHAGDGSTVREECSCGAERIYRAPVDCADDYQLRRRTRWIARPFVVEVIADNSGKWCGNALRFSTPDEAEVYARDLWFRWTLVRSWRVRDTRDDSIHKSSV